VTSGSAGHSENDLDPERVVVEHAELVRRIAYHLASRAPDSVEIDDLIQAGMLALLDAAGKFSASFGASFETYAGIRIRGAILDEMRRNSWAPRSTLKQGRLISQAIQRIESETGNDARSADVASVLGVSLDEYHQNLQKLSYGRLLSFDQLVDDPERAGQLPASPSPGPVEALEEEELRVALARVIESLPEREQLVLSLYYSEELNLREIGSVMGVTESRVSQIRSQAVLRINARIREIFEE
jgi:RNA polymerase sigma factor for flagellar operon FliA